MRRKKQIQSRKCQVWKLAEYSIVLVLTDPEKSIMLDNCYIHEVFDLLSENVGSELEWSFHPWEATSQYIRIS